MQRETLVEADLSPLGKPSCYAKPHPAIDKWKSGEMSDLDVVAFGDSTAVSHYKFTYDAEIGGTHRARTVICSDTWVNDSGTWKTASTHCSMVKGK